MKLTLQEICKARVLRCQYARQHMLKLVNCLVYDMRYSVTTAVEVYGISLVEVKKCKIRL
jgi:hypothetical protein